MLCLWREVQQGLQQFTRLLQPRLNLLRVHMVEHVPWRPLVGGPLRHGLGAVEVLERAAQLPVGLQ